MKLEELQSMCYSVFRDFTFFATGQYGEGDADVSECCIFHNKYMLNCRASGIDPISNTELSAGNGHTQMWIDRVNAWAKSEDCLLDFYSNCISPDEYRKLHESFSRFLNKLKSGALYPNDGVVVSSDEAKGPRVLCKNEETIVLPYDMEGNLYLVKKDGHYMLPRTTYGNKQKQKLRVFNYMLDRHMVEFVNILSMGFVKPYIDLISSDVEIFQALIVKSSDKLPDNCEPRVENVLIKTTMEEAMNLASEGKILCGLTLATLFKNVCECNLVNKIVGDKMDVTSLF